MLHRQTFQLCVMVVAVVMVAVFCWRDPSRPAAATVLVFAQSVASVPTPISSPQSQTAPQPVSITVDYPEDGSIFPPEITPPTFLWHDVSAAATHWNLDIAFSDGSAGLHATSAGERLKIGEIDPRCVSPSNQPPSLTPEQGSAHTWIPDAATWDAIKLHSKEHPVTITISGFPSGHADGPLSRGKVTLTTSKDPVGAPIFYRDVPLIPSKSQTGIIQPLATQDLPLLAWRLRDIAQPRGRLVLTGMHTCANCHSFSADGKTLGMDLDGPSNDKGLYALTAVKPEMSIRNQDVISWSSIKDRSSSPSRIGFMSQVSPDGKYVLTMLRGQKAELPNSYFVVNFTDYRFLQVFYPTRGTLAWYNRETGQKQPLPGADDPRYVHTDPVWSPDGKTVVFARAAARDPLTPGQRLPDHANSPDETQIKFDLYRMSFNDGKGGEAVPIEGASNNGMSNSFPKVSPDGRWIVFVKARNGLLMRPDSQLYIVPATGGVARRLRCNTPLMNSWHSFSPNGHLLVFSSKSRSPYTQMFLTHIDADGNSSPAILIDNATAANRAVNLPEFVNIPAGGMVKIDVPAAESYRLVDVASELTAKGRTEEAIAEWKKVLELDPDNVKALLYTGELLMWQGNTSAANRYLQRGRELDPNASRTEIDVGMELTYREQFNNAIDSSDCDSAASYGKEILGVVPDDTEVSKSLTGCAVRQARQQMRTALAASDWQKALSFANQLLTLQPGDDEARRTKDQCSLAVADQR